VATTSWMVNALNPRGVGPAARAFSVLHGLLLAAGLAAVVIGTVPSLAAADAIPLTVVADTALVFFAIEYAARLLWAPDHDPAAAHMTPLGVRLRWIVSIRGLIDLLAWLPQVLALLLAADLGQARLYGILWIFKLGRHAPRLGVLTRVLRQARESLLSVFFGFLIVLLLAATLVYLVEGPRQPDNFGSIPQALWWAITTLTTTGYGDVVPATPFGRLIAGTVMVCGIFVFALWAGILATEFAHEMRRHEFLRTWDLVAKVPYFQNVGAPAIADVAHVLKPRELAAGAVVMRRGDPGDCMYFIVEGEIEIQVKPNPVRLGPGSFFGEIALITGGPRTATVVASRKTTLLELDIVDFREIAARRPELLKAIDEEASRRVEQARSSARSGA
jgi:voltage-gated potassium channel